MQQEPESLEHGDLDVPAEAVAQDADEWPGDVDDGRAQRGGARQADHLAQPVRSLLLQLRAAVQDPLAEDRQ